MSCIERQEQYRDNYPCDDYVALVAALNKASEDDILHLIDHAGFVSAHKVA